MGGQTRQSRAASVCFADGFPCGGGLFGVRQPHRYGRAYARFTLDAQAVGIAEAVLQPAVNIPDAHMAVFGGGLLGAGLLQGFGGLRMFISQYSAEYGLIMAASVIALIPVLIVFLSLQKYFVQGVASSGLKG